MSSHPFEVFERRDATEAELRGAAEQVAPVVETPSFWSAIANDATRADAHRMLALIQLVRRHVSPGTTTVGSLAEMLDGAPWLGDHDIALITAIGGKIPVAWSAEDTVVAIGLPSGRGAIYLTIAGRFTAHELTAALRGESRDMRVLSAIIRDAGSEAGRQSPFLAP